MSTLHKSAKCHHMSEREVRTRCEDGRFESEIQNPPFWNSGTVGRWGLLKEVHTDLGRNEALLK